MSEVDILQLVFTVAGFIFFWMHGYAVGKSHKSYVDKGPDDILEDKELFSPTVQWYLEKIKNEPNNWGASRHCLYYPYNEKTKEYSHMSEYELWISNGEDCCHPYKPVDMKATNQESKALWAVYKWWCRNINIPEREEKIKLMRSLQ